MELYTQYHFKYTDQTATNSRVFCIYFVVFFKCVAFLICVMILPWYPVSVGTRVSPVFHTASDESWGCENLKTRQHHISIDTFDLPFWLIKPLQDTGGASFENEEEIRKQAQIHQKGQLTQYQQRINEVAGEICLHNPSMLARRGKLLEMCRLSIDKSGFQYKKRSRSKVFGTGNKQTKKRPKFDKDLRMERIGDKRRAKNHQQTYWN